MGLSAHLKSSNHDFDFDDNKILHKENFKLKLRIAEAINVNRDSLENFRYEGSYIEIYWHFKKISLKRLCVFHMSYKNYKSKVFSKKCYNNIS